MKRKMVLKVIERWGLSPSDEGDILKGIKDDWKEGEVEHHLIGYFLERGEEGWNYIVRRCSPVVEPLVRAKVPLCDVEMVMEDFLARLWKSIRSYEGKGKLDNWLLKLAKSVVADYWREKLRYIPLPDDFPQCWEDDIGVELDREMLREEVRKCVEELPERLRIVAIKRFIEEKKIEEIAKELRRPKGTICRQCAEVKHIFYKKLKNFWFR